MEDNNIVMSIDANFVNHNAITQALQNFIIQVNMTEPTAKLNVHEINADINTLFLVNGIGLSENVTKQLKEWHTDKVKNNLFRGKIWEGDEETSLTECLFNG